MAAGRYCVDAFVRATGITQRASFAIASLCTMEHPGKPQIKDPGACDTITVGCIGAPAAVWNNF